MTTVARDAPPISWASPAVSAAVDPSRKLFSPAWPAACRVWIWLSSTIPRPKNTLSTVPIAVSSGSLVWSRIHWTHRMPSAPDSAAPAISRARLRPVPPNDTPTRNARAIPGSVAWLIASEISARLRRKEKTPITPPPMPSAITPASTTDVL